MKLRTTFALLALALAACNPGVEAAKESKAGSANAPQAATGCKIEPPAEAVACTMDWRPVCGCNGETYSNPCVAKAAGVPTFTEGECGGEKLD